MFYKKCFNIQLRNNTPKNLPLEADYVDKIDLTRFYYQKSGDLTSHLSGRQVEQYFWEQYKMKLEYPHLPCVKTQRKGNVFPFEVRKAPFLV